jgi:hypothetical protein
MSTNVDGFKITTIFDSTTYSAVVNATTWSRQFRLKPNQNVFLSIAAWNEVGSSAAVASSPVTPQAPVATAPEAPKNVALSVSAPYNCDGPGFTVTCSWDVKVSWTDASSNETKFTIQQLPNGPTRSVGPNVTVWTGTERLALGSALAYRVRAENSVGASAWVQSNVEFLSRFTGN